MQSLFHTLYFEATRNCNLSCKYCSTGSNKNIKFLDIETETIIQKVFIPAKHIGTNHIEFSGGEFLVRDDAMYLLEVANEMGFKISIVSNGSTLTEIKIKQLKNLLGDNMLISLGINEFSSSNIDTRDYDYKKTLKLIKLLESYKISINICVTVGKFNADSFADTIENIEKLHLPFNRIPLVPRATACSDMLFDKELMRDKINPVLRKYFKGYVSYVPFFLPPDVYMEVVGKDDVLETIPTFPSIGCWIGSFYAINAEGDVAPCPLLLDNVSAGNVYKESLDEILFQSELFKGLLNRDKLKGKCGKCKYKYTCGGCRSMAFYKTGDIYAEDPDCFIDELDESEILKYEEETKTNFKKYCRMVKFSNTQT